MAGLFKTMNWSQPETTIQQTTSTPSTTFDDLLKGVGLSNTSNNANTNINMSDFLNYAELIQDKLRHSDPRPKANNQLT
jgi:hypothetical protein